MQEGKVMSIATGIKEDDLITIFEIARVALDVYSEQLSKEMDLEPEFLQKFHDCLNKRLESVYGSNHGGK